MPGWRFSGNRLTVSVFAGPVVQDYRLSPYDPGSKLHGLYVGGQFAAEVWYQPTAETMVAVNGTLASIGPTGSARTSPHCVLKRWSGRPRPAGRWAPTNAPGPICGSASGRNIDAWSTEPTAS
jgi:hypothetical protein